MRRLVVVTLTACALVLTLTDPTFAQRRGGAQKKAAPKSERIAQDLGELKWGMSLKQVVKHFTKKVDAKYRARIAKATSAIKEDKLRAKRGAEIKKIHDSIVRFDGEKTGWDVSFLKGEFTHNNGEALMVVHDDNSQNFYFFIHDKLWKWYKAFDASVFPGADFKKFASVIQGRYGEGVRRKGEATPGAGKRRWLEWQDKRTRLRAIDQTGFYGFYCLVFDDKRTVSRLAELRRVKSKQKGEMHAMVDSVTSPDSASDDAHRNVADRITGRMRVRENAPEQKNGKGGNSRSASVAPSEPTINPDDDPLRGL